MLIQHGQDDEKKEIKGSRGRAKYQFNWNSKKTPINFQLLQFLHLETISIPQWSIRNSIIILYAFN